jgi:dihydroorotate dehydrogenase (fumarate)
MSDPRLATRYLGLALTGPIIASAGPLTGRIDTLRRLEAAGAAAVVLPSLFEEEVIAEELHLSDMIDAGEDFAEFAGGVLPEMDLPDLGPGRHLKLLEQAKEALSVPVIASLNATHSGSWERYATLMVDAGADAIELNLYAVAADPAESAAEVEARALDVIAEVKSSISVPLAVKLSPFYSSLAHFAAAAIGRGADGLVLFNRFYAPDIDLSVLDVVPRVDLSSSADLRLPLRWLGILRAQLPEVGLACSSGVHTGADAIKALLVGADVACTTASVLHHGPEHLATMLTQLREWLAEHDYDSVDQLRASMSAASVADPSAFERSQYMAIVTSMRDRI